MLQGLLFIKYQGLGHEVDPSVPSNVEVQNDIPLLSVYAVMTRTETTLPLRRRISVIKEKQSRYRPGVAQRVPGS